MIFGKVKTPAIEQKLTQILVDIEQNPDVLTAVIASDDGLTIAANDKDKHVIAAATGSMLTAVAQSIRIMHLAEIDSIALHLADNQVMVCQTFYIDKTELILTIIFKQEIAYKRLIAQTIQAIRHTVEL